ncbi:MAG: hypothetical protein ACTSQJ_05980 [Promethearchaeota archaeon]
MLTTTDIVLIFIEVVFVLIILLINLLFNKHKNKTDNKYSIENFSNLKCLSPPEIAFIQYKDKYFQVYPKMFEIAITELYSKNYLKIINGQFVRNSYKRELIEIDEYSSQILKIFPEKEPASLNNIVKKHQQTIKKHKDNVPNQLVEKGLLYKSHFLLKSYGLLVFFLLILPFIYNFFGVFTFFIYYINIVIILSILALSLIQTSFKRYILNEHGHKIKTKAYRLLNELKLNFENVIDNKMNKEQSLLDLKTNLGYLLLIPDFQFKHPYDDSRLLLKNWIEKIIETSINLHSNSEITYQTVINDIYNFLEKLNFIPRFVIPSTFFTKTANVGSGG